MFEFRFESHSKKRKRNQAEIISAAINKGGFEKLSLSLSWSCHNKAQHTDDNKIDGLSNALWFEIDF